MRLCPQLNLPLEADRELNLGAGPGSILVELFREVPFPRQGLQAHSAKGRRGTKPLLCMNTDMIGRKHK